jgi:glycosyltransferase involved in cell wall biosynthesis
MKIAIAGTRGIPNDYGGFEQCAEYLSVIFSRQGHQVTVYNTHDHPYRNDVFKDVTVKHIFNPEKKIGTAGNFIYDYLCMRDAVRNGADILLVLGYTTASVFYPVMDFKNTILVTNMDGLEWKRDKWNSVVKKMALWFEKLGAKFSHYHISDNQKIRRYLLDTYRVDSTCIAYGSNVVVDFDKSILDKYQLKEHAYSMILARLEAENNIEMILEGYCDSKIDEPILVIGKINTTYGVKLKSKYSENNNVKFLGGIYDMNILNSLRHYCRYYFHGHSVGGTNPSLLEAMASGTFIMAHNNQFNKWVTGDHAKYFNDAADIKKLVANIKARDEERTGFINENTVKIHDRFNWDKIAEEYLNAFKTFINDKH